VTFIPPDGIVGNDVILNGSGFMPGDSVTPYFGGISYSCNEGVVDVTLGGFFNCTVTVPALPAGTYVIAAMTADDGLVTAAATFTVDPALTFSPSSGIVGSNVVLNGSGFTASDGVTPYFGGISHSCNEGTVDVATDGSFNCTVTVPATPANNYAIAASTADDGTVAAVASFTVDPALTFNPSSGIVGSDVVLTGSGFTTGDAATASFGGGSYPCIEGTVYVAADGSFTCTVTVPPSPADSYGISASTIDDGVVAATGTYAVTQSLTLGPTSGDVGTTTAATGTGFAGTSTITFTLDGTPATSTCSSGGTGSFSCTVTIPYVPDGAQTMTSTDLSSNSADATYIVYWDPTVSVTPSGPLTYDVGQTASLLTAKVTYSGSNPYSIKWFSSSTSPCGSGSTSTGISGTTYTPPTSSAGTTYYCAAVFDSAVTGYSSNSSSVKVTVSPALLVGTPTANLSAIDFGQQTALISPRSIGGSGGNTHAWYVDSVNTDTCGSGTSNFLASAPSWTTGAEVTVPGTYYYCDIVTDSNGNSQLSGFVTITVDPALSAGIASATQNPVDVDQATTISVSGTTGGSGSGTYTYAWSGLPGGCSGSTSSFSCTPNDNSGSPYTVTLTVTDGNGNSVIATFPLTVDPALSPGTVSATVNPVDVGQGTVISTSGASGGSGLGTYTFAWSGLPAGCSSTTSSFTCTPTDNSGSPYTVALTVTDGNANTATATFSLTVDPALSAGTVSAAVNPVDVGQATTISTTGATGGSGAGTYGYVWSGLPAGCTGSGTSFHCSPTGNSGSPYTVELTVSDGNGNSVAATFSLVVDQALSPGTVSASVNPVDVGQTTTIMVSGTSGGSGTGTYLFTWSGLPAGCSSTSSAFSCTPTSNSGSPYTVTLIVTDGNGKTATATFTLTVAADPTVTVTPIGPITYDESQSAAALTATIVYSGRNTATVEWYNSTSTSCSSGSTDSRTSGTAFTPSTLSAGTTYYCAVVSDAGAAGYSFASNAVEIIVVADPTVDVAPVGPLSFDVGQTAGALTATIVYIGLNNVTVEWYSSANHSCGSGSTGTGVPGTSFAPSTSSAGTTYYCAVLSDPALRGYVFASNVVEVNVSVVPTVRVAPLGPLEYDLGQAAISLNATVTYSGPNTVTVEWYSSPFTSCGPRSNDSGISGTNYTPSTLSTGTTYYCAVITDSGVSGYAYASNAVAVIVDPLIGIFAFTTSHVATDVGLPVTFTASAFGGTTPYTYTYTGLPSGCESSNNATLTCVSLGTGVFTVRVFVNDSVGLSATSTLSLTVHGTLSIRSFAASLNPTDVGVAITLTVSPFGGTSAYTYAYTGLPGGCKSVSADFLVCTPATSGTFTVRVFVNDSVGKSTSSTISLVINPVLTVTSFSAISNTIDIDSSISLSVFTSGGTSPYAYSYTGLPEGCTTSGTDALSCTPAVSGIFTIRVFVNDSAGTSATATLLLTVNAAASSTQNYLGLPVSAWYVVVVILIVAIALILAVPVLAQRKSKSADGSEAKKEKTEPTEKKTEETTEEKEGSETSSKSRKSKKKED
jgi:hypothetical protein